MKKRLRSAVSLVLVTSIVALSGFMLPYAPATFAQSPSRAPGQDKAKDSTIKVLKGDAVKQRVQQLRIQNKALNRALKDMEKLGKYPNWDASAAIRDTKSSKTRAASALPGAPTFLPASYTQQQQDYYTDGNGNEMIIITAYGSDDYWDGTIYTTDGSTGQTDTYNGVLDDLIAGDPDSSDVVDEVYYPPDGSGGVRETSCDAGQRCLQMEATAKNDVKEVQPRLGIATRASYAPAAKPMGFLGWFKRYFRCIKRCGALASQFCFQKYSNSFRNYFLCLAIGATAASITCAFNTNSCS